MRRQVCDDRAALAEHGLEPVSFAYPFGIVDAEVARVVADCGYRSGRTASGSKERRALAESIPPLDPFALRVRPSVKQGKSLGAIQGYVSAAERQGGGWVQLVFHRLCDAGCDLYSISPAAFSALLAWLAPRAAQGTVVRRVDEVIGGRAP